MAKLTFADVVDKEFTIYEVSRGGSIAKYEGVSLKKRKIHNVTTNVTTEEYFLDRGCLMSFDASEIHNTAAGLNKNGNIHIGWGHAVFLNKEDAQALAIKIVNTKYKNSIKKIRNI